MNKGMARLYQLVGPILASRGNREGPHRIAPAIRQHTASYQRLPTLLGRTGTYDCPLDALQLGSCWDNRCSTTCPNPARGSGPLLPSP